MNTGLTTKQRSLLRAGLAIAGLLAAIAACSGKPVAPAKSGNIYPTGIVPFKNSAIGLRNGIFASADSAHCCFLGRVATLTLQKPAGLRSVTLRFYVPGEDSYGSGGLVVKVSVPGASTSAHLKNGTLATITIKLPAALASASTVPLSINPSKTFQSAGSTLSVILIGVQYR